MNDHGSFRAYRSVLDPYRDSAEVIESSDLDVSRGSVAALMVKLPTIPGLEGRRSVRV